MTNTIHLVSIRNDEYRVWKYADWVRNIQSDPHFKSELEDYIIYFVDLGVDTMTTWNHAFHADGN